MSGDDENGLLIAAEAHLLQNKQPIAFAAIQWDGKTDQFSMLIGVNLTPKHFLKRTPDWIDQIAKLSGTLFICNKPVVVALGRLSDTRTWFSLTFEFNMWARFLVQFGICFEYSEAPNGGKGFGFIARIEGTINGGIVKVIFNARVRRRVRGLQDGVERLRGGLLDRSRPPHRAVPVPAVWDQRPRGVPQCGFGPLAWRAARGDSAGDAVVSARRDLDVRCDVWHARRGRTGCGRIGAAFSMAIDTARQKGQTVHVERIDPTWTGEGVGSTLSVRELRTMALDEAGRLARFAANSETAPIATDSCLSIEFSVAVNDNIGVGGAAPGQGNQNSGDLVLNYDLIGLAVRRRARFGPDRNWYPLQQKIELAADFSDPAGVDLSGTFEAQQLTLFWSKDVQVEGQTASKKLLVNSKTPYDYQTKNPETDEETVKNDPAWPCCGRKKVPYRIHELLFRNEAPGADVEGYRFYSQSHSRFRFLQGAYAFPANFGTVLPPNTIVAVAADVAPGVVFRADLDESAGICFFRLFWNTPQASLQLVAFDGSGQQVGMLAVAPGPDFQNVVDSPRRPGEAP